MNSWCRPLFALYSFLRRRFAAFIIHGTTISLLTTSWPDWGLYLVLIYGNISAITGIHPLTDFFSRFPNKLGDFLKVILLA